MCPPHCFVSQILLFQGEISSFDWAYLWLAAGGLLLILTFLAFLYLLVERHRNLAGRLIRSSIFQRIDGFLQDHVPWLWRFIRRRFRIHEWRGLALTVATVVGFAALALFAVISESWIDEEALYAFDQRVYSSLMEAANPGVVDFMRIITHFADGLTVTLVSVVAGGLLLLYRMRWEVVSLLLAVGVGTGVMFGLKWVFDRSRPTESLIQVAGHSFPSGHAFFATTLYGWLIYLTWRLVRQDAARIAATIALTLLIFLIGTSRVILRVHWTSDVAGGFTMGFAWLVASLILTQVIRTYYAGRLKTQQDVVPE